ncbi:type I-D CRISPR-associated helicase Cas3' [Cuspidothrix issatschenkoi LEGE 03284]|uniref:type I-D CRISPR-associated helicase Cas3' n=1 Tax=Cuspidothrix issatschenkoi TaxID=230752 RepID=UPI0018803A6F|nr:type I-D CRISPR-associated helicase Cas3' [Cuspidothrix issatschenkoi]MBE9234052.1 type I-D CRISPR-associated helicase Cas3' [Cuspidothrix issatschenkoi LEGE 03284]
MATEFKIQLKPVYSQTVPTADGVKLPDGWCLSWHQLETLKALRDPNIDVVFNTAMTGDGKSLAAYLEVLQGEFCAIGLYPTNELARDQETQIKGYIDIFQPENQPRIVKLSGADLEIYAENEGLKKGAAILTLSSQREVLLTNPDIFHYLHRSNYLITGDSPEKLWNKIDKDFDVFIFDEFHVFAAPQIASIINTMLLIHCTNRRKKFLFLSATPDQDLISKLKIAGFRCKEINPLVENKYQFPDNTEQEAQLKTQNWRQVTRGITLNFMPLEPSFKAAETWLKANSDLIISHFQKYPGSKGAIILNSIASVKRLTPFFQELLDHYNLKVGENTGLSSKGEKELSLAADLVLGTSTIDVGVDFKINFLIFESADSGNFIQRLGRLGRHDGYKKNGQEVKFENYTAYALIPNFLVERLFQTDSPPLQVDNIYDRPFSQQTIKEQYRKINDFHGYYRRWGAVQSFWLCFKLSDRTIKQQYTQSGEKFKIACEKVFDTSLKSQAGHIQRWAKEWREKSGKSGNPIAEDAASFRGSSPLQCGLYDLTETNENERFKTYDLPGILSNLEIEMWTEGGFMRTLKETAARTGQPIAKGRFTHCLAFINLKAYREERLNWKFTYSGDLQPIADAWKVQVLTGVGVWQPDNVWIGQIDKKLKKEGLVCYVIRRSVIEVRMRLRLPMHFQIYPISDQYSVNDTSSPYSIAFGQSALLLDTLAYKFKSKGEEIWVV